jgi:hypothetical protein
VRRGDQPLTYTDSVAIAHDIRYQLHGGDDVKIREADVKMVQALKKASAEVLDSSFNIKPAQLAIESKMKMENVGLMKPSKFAPVSSTGPEDTILLQQKLNQLEQEGKGLRNAGGKLLDETHQRLLEGSGLTIAGTKINGNGLGLAGKDLSGGGKGKKKKKHCCASCETGSEPCGMKKYKQKVLTGRGHGVTPLDKRRVSRETVNEASHFIQAMKGSGVSKKLGSKTALVAWTAKNFPKTSSEIQTTIT